MNSLRTSFLAALILIIGCSEMAFATYQSSREEQIQYQQQLTAKNDKRFLANLSNYIRKHGGSASMPTCIDRSDQRDWVREVCSGRLCVQVSGSSERQRSTTSGHANSIYFCTVELRGGIKCDVGFLGTWQTFGGSCSDSGGKERKLTDVRTGIPKPIFPRDRVVSRGRAPYCLVGNILCH